MTFTIIVCYLVWKGLCYSVNEGIHIIHILAQYDVVRRCINTTFTIIVCYLVWKGLHVCYSVNEGIHIIHILAQYDVVRRCINTTFTIIVCYLVWKGLHVCYSVNEGIHIIHIIAQYDVVRNYVSYDVVLIRHSQLSYVTWYGKGCVIYSVNEDSVSTSNVCTQTVELKLKFINILKAVILVKGFIQLICYHNSYVQTVPNHRRLLIIDDKSLPHKQRRAFTRLLIFKIKFSRQAPSR